MGQPKLANLPPELLNHIFTYIDFTDLQALGSTNKAFRTTLEPSIFRAVRLDSNPSESWPVLATLAERPHIRTSVTTLSYLGTPDHLVRQAGFDPSINVVPELARQALSGSLFPHVKTVYIKFDFGEFDPISSTTTTTTAVDDNDNNNDAEEGEEWDDESEYAVGGCIDSIYTFEIPELDPENTARKERKFPWRGMMNQVWGALALNRNVIHLSAVNLLPKPTSTFYTSQWAAFIGGLESLDVSTWYGNNGAGWDANTNTGYTHFYAVQMHELFYKHCGNLARLGIDASAGNAIGGGDGACHDEEKLLLDSGCFPKLERLELAKICMNDVIAGFIVDKTKEEHEEGGVAVLRSVVLWNCHVNTDSGMTSWKQFFELLLGDNEEQKQKQQQSNLRGLRELDISYLYGDDVTIPCAPDVEDAPYCEPETDEQETLLTEMQTSSRKAFSYICNDSKYGDTVLASLEVFDAFKIGEDERAYQRIMERIERNNAALS